MGLNFYYFECLQPKMRAGIINEHECTFTNSIRVEVLKGVGCELHMHQTKFIIFPNLKNVICVEGGPANNVRSYTMVTH